MVDGARNTRMRRSLAIAFLVVAGVMLMLVGLALWNPWQLTALFPIAQQGTTVALLVLAGGLVASTVVLRFATSSRAALFALVASLVAVPALCVGLPVVVFSSRFRVESDQVLNGSPDGGFSVVKETSPDKIGVRLFVRSQRFLFGRQSDTPIAECLFDPFERGVPPEAVRFTSETTVAVPVTDESTVVVQFDTGTLMPDQTVEMC